MERDDFELQLKVWKDLAISKQVLMQTAAKSLGLAAECTTEELESALNTTIQQVKGLEQELNEVRERSAAEIERLKNDVEQRDKDIKKLTAEKEEALSGKEAAENRAEVGRATNAEELKKMKAQVAEKDRELKKITKTLADTPENVVKKLKALKKEKMDEANLRKKAEENARKQRKEKQDKEQELKDTAALIEEAGKYAAEIRELHKLANEQFDQLAEGAEDKKSLTQVPALNEQLLEALEAKVEGAEKADDKADKKKSKKK
ncbi:hypothetical protein [Aliikangiella sp. G2MR2-5]|uniref:hypothetical protein n=1 Tax=Aliikangiella sp. G2MR2-5 TaxID=2788943 RepID=UPI0018AB9E0A|nr:hypothetical protein [Aliikangiella sp. G2MR2-5]